MDVVGMVCLITFILWCEFFVSVASRNNIVGESRAVLIPQYVLHPTRDKGKGHEHVVQTYRTYAVSIHCHCHFKDIHFNPLSFKTNKRMGKLSVDFGMINSDNIEQVGCRIIF